MGLGFQGEKGVKVNRFWNIHCFPCASRNVSSCTCVPACVGGFGSLPWKVSISHPSWVVWWVSLRVACAPIGSCGLFPSKYCSLPASYCQAYMSDECTLLKFILSSFHLWAVICCLIFKNITLQYYLSWLVRYFCTHSLNFAPRRAPHSPHPNSCIADHSPGFESPRCPFLAVWSSATT